MKDPAPIIANLIATSLMPTGSTWASARYVFCWERDALDYLHARRCAGDCPPINAWTAMLLNEGYPAAKAGADQGKYWKPPHMRADRSLETLPQSKGEG